MYDIKYIGLDFGLGAMKAYSDSIGVQMVSQVALKSNNPLGKMAGLKAAQATLDITLSNGLTFAVDKNAHDSGTCIENLDMYKLADGTPDMLALLYGVFTRFFEKDNSMNSRFSIICGLPIEMVSGNNAHGTLTRIQDWLKCEHCWRVGKKEYRIKIEEVAISSQPAGALFDYTLTQEGRVILERSSALSKEIGIISIGMNTVELLSVRSNSPIEKFSKGSTMGVRRLLELLNPEDLFTIGELDNLLRSKKIDISQALPVWEREVIGEIEKCWGKAWRRFTNVIVVGGGAILLKSLLQTYFCGKAFFPDDPVISIARGLWKLKVYQDNMKKEII